jgi:type II secretory ATPase GspE/PulE/Tfp pilus assembly ATPase PilB-like protein/CheY-like chemotaxis protein
MANSDFLRFRQTLIRAYPEQAAKTAEASFDGPVDEAWSFYSQLLGVSQAAMARAIAPFFGLQAAPSLEHPSTQALAMLTYEFCEFHTVLPLEIERDRLVIATASPFDVGVIEWVGFWVDSPLRWVIAPPKAIRAAIDVVYGHLAAPLIAPLADAMLSKNREVGVESVSDPAMVEVPQSANENAIVRLTRGLLGQAVARGASDLHIQPFQGSFAVRLRVDGQLNTLTMLPDQIAVTVVRHLKARAGMESTNTQIPQDGRITMVLGKPYDMRVSSLPTERGERLVIRFIDQSRVFRLSQSRFSLAALKSLRRTIDRPAGLVLVTGPTGSGKTSTLYSLLAELNRSNVNIITVEDPVEYRLPRISQVQVNEKAGLTFGTVLRSILRQDPDILLIGEIRDRETAEIAAQAALTGHLVLSTLHTTDAISTISRLLNLGVDSVVLADALAGVFAQRLCAQLCGQCKEPIAEPFHPNEKLFIAATRNQPGYRPKGCSQCNFTGYRGRLPIVESVEMTSALRDAVAAGASQVAVLDRLREGGLKSLAVSGSLRIISGETTVEEVIAAVGSEAFWQEISAHYGTTTPMPALQSRLMVGDEMSGVLLISKDKNLANGLRKVLAKEGLRLEVAGSAEQAQDLLNQHEQMSYIIGDIPEAATLPEATDLLRRNRLHISWARLPAAVLIPATLYAQRDSLKLSGVMAELLPKPVSASRLLELINTSRSR